MYGLGSKDSLNSTKNVALLLLGIFLAGLMFFAGFVTGNGLTAIRLEAAHPLPTEMPLGSSDDSDFQAFWEAWQIIDESFYYDLPNTDVRVHGAIQGMIGTLGDPYTAFIPPDVAEILRQDNSGTFEGIGAYVEEAPEGGVHIIRVFENGPADQAGLRAGDVVIAVDGQDVTEKILNESLLLIRGPAGTPVVLTIVREGHPGAIDITIIRARLDIPTVEARMLDDKIGYVALYEFNATASSRLERAIKELQDQGAEALIFDLRDNPGGFLDQAISVADLFLPEGIILIQRDTDGNVSQHRSKNGQLAETIPLVVLINGNSASASEIVAGAIQDRGRGILIGETSFGKGSVQMQYDLSDGSQIRVTSANWFTPNDTLISEKGITPDIVVEIYGEVAGVDAQIERAAEYLQAGQ